MNLFDIVGPVMVGPSSSHTAGAVKIGEISRKLFHVPIMKAELLFHGSFLATGKGHGTDKALVAGLLGLAVDDPRIPDAFTLAKEAGMHLTLGSIDLGDSAHPNSVKINLFGENATLSIVAASIGGGRIEIREIDGLKAVFHGDKPTLIVQNDDTPGKICDIAGVLYNYKINIATMQLDRDARGGHAVTVIETDQEIPEEALVWLGNREGMLKITYLSMR